MNKPNFIICLGDDHSWHDLGCYGSSDADTPNIDRVAREGVRFTHAFTATAMCAPSRSQLYTGLFPVKNGAYPNHSLVYPGTKSIPYYLLKLGYRTALAGKTHIGPRESFPFEYLPADIKSVDAWIGKHAHTQHPFLLVFASNNPHAPHPKHSKFFDPKKITLPPYLIDTSETRELYADYLYHTLLLDQEIGAILEIMEKYEIGDNTLFIYTSEQGSGFPFAKWTCYDAGLRVAFVARWPEIIKPGSVTHAMIQYVDVVPTLIEAAGGDPPKGLDGRSFLKVLIGEKDEHRDVVYGVHTTRGIINGTYCYPIRSIRTRTHKLILNLNHEATFTCIITRENSDDYGRMWISWLKKAEIDPEAKRRVKFFQHRPPLEFYNLIEDPWELHNLALSSVSNSENCLITELKQKLEYWMKEQGDFGIETEMKAFERQAQHSKF